MDTMVNIVAAKKLSSLKENCKRKGIDPDKHSPETERKVKERMEKDLRKREEEKEKRSEKYDERERQREKLRSRIRDKYNVPEHSDAPASAGLERPDTKEKSKKSVKSKKKELKEKDFYKYNKALPDERGKKLEKEPEHSAGQNFATMSQQLAEDTPNKSEKDCVIS